MKIFHADAFSSRFAQDNVLGLNKAFAKVAEVKSFDYRENIKRHAGKPNPAHVDEMNRRFVREVVAFRPDLLHLSKCELVKPAIVARVKRATGCTVTHMVGDWRPDIIPWAAAMGTKVDLTLFQHRDKTVNQRYLDAGCNRVAFWPSGVDPEVFFPRSVNKQYDVVFMANWPLNPLEETKAGQGNRVRFILALARSGIKITLFGNSAAKMAAHHTNLTGHPFVSGNAFAVIVSASKIALGYNAEAGYCYTSWPRPLKTMACGCFYLTKGFPGIETLFSNEEHLGWCDSIVKMQEAIQYYLHHDTNRETIAAAGRQKVLAEHTWDVRVRQLLELIDNG